MEGFTVIDAVVAVVIVLSALLAYSRGIVREVLAIGGWIAAGILSFIFAPQVAPLVKEVPFIGPFISDNCELSMITGFAAVFAVVLLIASLFTPLFSSVVQKSALGPGLSLWCGAGPFARCDCVLRLQYDLLGAAYGGRR